MPTELEELVEFLHHGNTQIRQIAVENLVPFSKTNPSIFKRPQLVPVKDLKLLVKDYAPIAKNILTILINISEDAEVLQNLAKDEAFLESVLLRMTNPKEPNANDLCMLLANMTKHDSLSRLLTLQRPSVSSSLSKSKHALSQLLDLYVRGSTGTYNPHADFEYLAYVFADLAKFPDGGPYFTTPAPHDSIHPIAKLLPFTSHASIVRRVGAVSTVKNISFTTATHAVLLAPPLSALPYVLLPLASGEDTYTEEENEKLPDELQFLDAGVKREGNVGILKVLLETLLLWTTEREGREELRRKGAYYVVRECHLRVEDEEVKESVEKLVNVLMRDEEGDNVGGRVEEIEEGGGTASEGRMIMGTSGEEEEAGHGIMDEMD